jgi:hypothetical protein
MFYLCFFPDYFHLFPDLPITNYQDGEDKKLKAKETDGRCCTFEED